MTTSRRFRAAEARLWESVALEPEEVWLDLPRTRARVRALTVGDPAGQPLLFVHGGSNSASSWVDLAARLTHRCCVMVDRPGCGLSPRLPEPLREQHALNAFADAFLADVVDAIAAPSADVIGTSFGGYFSLRGAAAHPSSVDRLVLLGYSIGAPVEYLPPMMRMSVIPGIGKLMARLPPPRAAIKPMLRQIGLRDAVDSGRFDAVRIAWFLELLRETDTMLNELRDMPPLMSPLKGLNDSMLLSDATLAAVTMPTLMVWGRSDPMGGESVARAFAARLPTATLDLVEGGHAVWMDDPDGIGARVAAFLN